MNIQQYLGKYVILTSSSDFVYIMRVTSIENSEVYNDICYSFAVDTFYQNGGKWGKIENIKHICLATTKEIKEYLHITYKVNYYEIY